MDPGRTSPKSPPSRQVPQRHRSSPATGQAYPRADRWRAGTDAPRPSLSANERCSVRNAFQIGLSRSDSFAPELPALRICCNLRVTVLSVHESKMTDRGIQMRNPLTLKNASKGRLYTWRLIAGGSVPELRPTGRETMQIVFAASEAVPFAKTGGLADVVGALSREIAKLGHQVSVFLPLYASVRPHLEKELSYAVRSITIPFPHGNRFVGNRGRRCTRRREILLRGLP